MHGRVSKTSLMLSWLSVKLEMALLFQSERFFFEIWGWTGGGQRWRDRLVPVRRRFRVRLASWWGAAATKIDDNRQRRVVAAESAGRGGRCWRRDAGNRQDNVDALFMGQGREECNGTVAVKGRAMTATGSFWLRTPFLSQARILEKIRTAVKKNLSRFWGS